MTPLSQKKLREFLGQNRPEVVADIGGRQSYQVYADICPADVYDLESEPSFDICNSRLPRPYSHIVCTDTFEHIFEPTAAGINIGESLTPEGLLFLTTVSNWPEHKHPVDTYRFMEDGLRYIFRHLNIERCWYEDDPDGGQRISIVARKKAQ